MTSAADRTSREKIARIYCAVKSLYGKASIEKLLRKEGDVNCGIPRGREIVPNLLFFARSMHTDEFVLLLEHGADFTRKNSKGRTVVHEMIRDEKDYLSRIYRNGYIYAVLHAHVEFDNPSNPMDENGITHFHVACMMNVAAAVEFFLRNGVDVDQAVNADSSIYPLYTPLHLAVKHVCWDVIGVLLEYGANIFSKNRDGMSPMHLLVEMNIAEWPWDLPLRCKNSLGIFLKHAINELDDVVVADYYDGFCVLHAACVLEDESSIEHVLKRIPNVNQAVNIDSPVYAGFTALHFAAFSSLRIFEFLLKNGADIEAKNAKGETPFDLCLQKYSVEDIHAIISTKSEWKNITLSDNETKLVDAVAACASTSSLITFYNEIKTDSIIVPCDSPLWPGYTLLHLGVVLKHKELDDDDIFQHLLKRRSDLAVKDAKGMTPLHLAFYMHNYNLVRDIIHDPHTEEISTDENNLSDFHIACAVHDIAAFEHFLSIGASVTSPVRATFKAATDQDHIKHVFFICSGSTPLHINIASGRALMTRQLLEHGANVNAQDVNGFTPVHRLLSTRAYSISRLRSNAERFPIGLADVLLSDENLTDCVAQGGLSHLHVACYYGLDEAVEKLIRMGADVNALVTYEGNAKKYHNYQYILDEYGDPDGPLNFLRDYAGYSPLHFTLLKQHHQISYLLINNGADFCRKNGEGISFLDYLSGLQFREQIAVNMLNDSPVIQRYFEEKFGMTKLHLACCTADVKLVANAVSSGVNINAKIHSDSPVWRGYTPLHVAAVRAVQKFVDDKLKEVVKLLIKHGADLTVVDDNDDTPIHLPMNHPSKTMICYSVVNFLFKYLKNYGTNPANLEGLTLFHIACAAQNVAAVKNYLKHGVDVDQAIGEFSDFHPGSTALHLAIKYYQTSKSLLCKIGLSDEIGLQIVDLLIRNGANVNAGDIFGNTPLIASLGTRDLRQILIPKLISNGADVFATNIFDETAIDKADRLNICEINDVLKLMTIERTRLINPAIASLNRLLKSPLPDLCCRNIISYLNNEHLKRLIVASVQ